MEDEDLKEIIYLRNELFKKNKEVQTMKTLM